MSRGLQQDLLPRRVGGRHQPCLCKKGRWAGVEGGKSVGCERNSISEPSLKVKQAHRKMDSKTRFRVSLITTLVILYQK